MKSPSTLQDFPYASGLQAVKESVAFNDFAAFCQHLVASLPQNSPETRKRYASLIIRWFFPEHSLHGLFPLVWQTYGDEQLMEELLRVTALEVEPAIASFVVEHILPLLPGQILDANKARDYILATYGGFKRNSYQRLLTTCRHLGFIERLADNWVIAFVPPPVDALLLLIHYRMAPTPRIVRLSDLLDAGFWRYLGFRAPEEVRAVLRQAQAAGLIARYSLVDDLEQFTTSYSLADYLEQKLKLGRSQNNT